MQKLMTKEQIEDLLDNVLEVGKRRNWKGDKIQFCCPVHRESNPSCGINLSYSPADSFQTFQVFHCFSCHAGGSIPKLLLESQPENFKNIKAAEKFIKERYNVSFGYSFDPTTSQIIRYEDSVRTPKTSYKKVYPKSSIAMFKGGKETYHYFFERGFTKKDMVKFSIGRDLEEETVTIPAFWEDGSLAGVVGRYIDPNRPKNMRFKVYDFQKSGLIYPLNHLKVINDTIIGCEAMFDAIALHSWGYTNTISTMGDGMSEEQAQQIIRRCKVFIDLFDNDKGGILARNIAKKCLGTHVQYLIPTYYPEKGKDPLSWGREETIKVIQSAKIGGHREIPRIE